MIKYYDDNDFAVFDGLVFRRDKRTGYYLNAKTHKRLHVYVWEYFNGEVPEGYHVHHADFDKSNNEPGNLVILPAKEHISLHGKSWNEERYKRQVDHLTNTMLPAAAEWHGSDAGHQWRREQYKRIKDKLQQKKTFICEQCGKEFESVYHGNNRFCSNACRTANRRESGVDNETRRCEWCGNEFVTNKYSKAKTCCRRCRNFLRWNKKNTESGS